MIEITKSFKTDDGQIFVTVEEAQKHELENMLEGIGVASCDETAEAIIANADKVIDILTMTPTSKPKARKVNGGTKKRTPKPAPATTPSLLPPESP